MTTPQRRYVTIHFVVWCCGNLKHRHRTEKASLACIARGNGGDSKLKSQKLKTARRRRNLKLFRMVLSGSSYSSASKALGITASRCRTLFEQGIRRMLYPQRPGVIYPDIDDCWGLIKIREHEQFWSGRIDALEKEWFPPPQK
jgi:hypothetical protein